MPTTTNTGPTLTDMTYIGRQTVKYGLIFLVVFMVGRTLLTAFIAYWRAINPPAPPPPTVGFGLLPPLAFPTSTGAVTSYRLETATGTLPSFGDRAKVFFMPKASLGLLSDQRAKEIAAEYDFVFTPEVLNDKTYRWTKTTPLESTLQIDLSNLNFTLTTDYLSRPELLSGSEPPEAFDAVARVKAMLNAAELLPPDVATASAETVYLKALGGELQPAVSYSDADYVEVNLNRTPIDGLYRMYTPGGFEGIIHAIVSGAFGGQDSIVMIEDRYHEVDYSQAHTYPLRPVDAAWRLLQSGEGYIANDGNGETAVVRSVSLGYFDSFAEQLYLQPVYVFEGDEGFLGYVPALDPKYLQTGPASQ